MQNILLGGAILAVAYVWYRTGFMVPRLVHRVPLSPRTMVVIAGCVIVVLTSGHAMGGVIGGRTQIAQSPVRYAQRDTWLFWREIILEVGVGAVVGGGLIVMGRAGRRATHAVHGATRSESPQAGVLHRPTKPGSVG